MPASKPSSTRSDRQGRGIADCHRAVAGRQAQHPMSDSRRGSGTQWVQTRTVSRYSRVPDRHGREIDHAVSPRDRNLSLEFGIKRVDTAGAEGSNPRTCSLSGWTTNQRLTAEQLNHADVDVTRA